MHWLTAKEVMEEVKKSKDLSTHVKGEIRKLAENAERPPKPREKQRISSDYSRFIDCLHDLQKVADALTAELASSAEQVSNLRMEIVNSKDVSTYVKDKIRTLIENAERLPKPRGEQRISSDYSRFIDRLHDLQKVADALTAELASSAEQTPNLHIKIENSKNLSTYAKDEIKTLIENAKRLRGPRKNERY